jgi:hypothetical protein
LIIRRKLNAPIKHTFAVTSYNSRSQVTWREGFTTDFQALDQTLSSLSSSCGAEARPLPCSEGEEGEGEGEGEGVRLGEVFAQLLGLVAAAAAAQTPAAEARGGADEPEQECLLTRFIFIYTRSSQVPLYPSTLPVFPAPASRTHFLDILFLHHKLAAHRECVASCQETINVLSRIQRGGMYCDLLF